MSIDKKYVDQIIKVSEKAALASSYLVGKKDKIAADKAAVDSLILRNIKHYSSYTIKRI